MHKNPNKVISFYQKFFRDAHKYFLNVEQSTAEKYLHGLITGIINGALNKNKQNISRPVNNEITSNEKQILHYRYIDGYLVMRALKKFLMHQHAINHLKSECIPEKFGLIKMQEKNCEFLSYPNKKLLTILYVRVVH